MGFAIPIAHVVETMRPLAIDTISGVPSFVLGLSVIRGAPVPIVDLEDLVGLDRTDSFARFVSLRIGPRRGALAVRRVVGVRDLDAISLAEMPPLVRALHTETIDKIGILDAQLLVVLRASKLLSEEAWLALSMRESPS